VSWQTWLAHAWPTLHAGREVAVPGELRGVVSALPVPRIAANVGQSANHVLSLSDGSRIHVHVFANGAMRAHRDRTDPARSPLHAVWHIATETPVGRGAAKSAVVGLALRTAARLLL
jgi:hypothetical protein